MLLLSVVAVVTIIWCGKEGGSWHCVGGGSNGHHRVVVVWSSSSHCGGCSCGQCFGCGVVIIVLW